MFQQAYNFIYEYWQYILGISGLAAALSWIPGGGAAIGIMVSVLKMVASAIEMAAPIISGIFSGIIWLWQKVLWPGLLNILSTWSSIFTVLLLCLCIWFSSAIKSSLQAVHTAPTRCNCNAEESRPVQPSLGIERIFPWNW